MSRARRSESRTSSSKRVRAPGSSRPRVSLLRSAEEVWADLERSRAGPLAQGPRGIGSRYRYVLPPRAVRRTGSHHRVSSQSYTQPAPDPMTARKLRTVGALITLMLGVGAIGGGTIHPFGPVKRNQPGRL